MSVRQVHDTPSAALQEAPCPLCGGTQRRSRFQEPPFGVWLCSGCDLTYVSPRIADEALLPEVYDATYWASPTPRLRGYRDYLGDTDLIAETFRRRLRGLSYHLPEPGSVLDVGCAAGGFLQVMEESGWCTLGLEPSPTMCEVARERLGPERVRAGGLECLREGELFDLITFWDVLEHLPLPQAALQRAAAHLAPGGRILVLTQNVASPFARLLGRRWQHYKHAEHLAHFHRGTLRAALEGAGFAVETMGARHAGKLIRLDFLVERATRISPWLERCLRPLLRLGNPCFYCNPMDELVAVASHR
ncbi:MAG TPA: methyltransferase domain-containing protein [Planctomycetota bacterium]|nr:methyltransferase domain-containing protein [Planctomycetota bacterium]